jgi:hypothetical protein
MQSRLGKRLVNEFDSYAKVAIGPRRASRAERAHPSFSDAIERGEKALRRTTQVKLANTFKIPMSQFLV